jgi:hypothetical protein
LARSALRSYSWRDNWLVLDCEVIHSSEIFLWSLRDQELGFGTTVDCEEPIVICWSYGVASGQLRGLCEMQKLDNGILKYNYILWCLRIGFISRFS